MNAVLHPTNEVLSYLVGPQKKKEGSIMGLRLMRLTESSSHASEIR